LESWSAEEVAGAGLRQRRLENLERLIGDR
jgi:hypothetical protein